ncbi:hypothetical protein OSB04_020152 [Centaurea solstitialis]|uniref:RRM domain-containing protein n=1 Tax=Centaurea solstitialis TaxID=347529 RepID=A0AA38WEY7_9ASTR|nr:hypothetical protein OSB04_020152 [Centaurea solstitialis]
MAYIVTSDLGRNEGQIKPKPSNFFHFTREVNIDFSINIEKAMVLRSPLGSDNLRGQARTFFFTNFSEEELERSLWQVFKKQGQLVDLYLARKRNGRGRRFGFVRFVKVSEWRNLEIKLNEIWLRNFKLRVNLARYGRKSLKSRDSSQGGKKFGGPSHLRGTAPTKLAGGSSSLRTFAEVVKGLGGLKWGDVVKTEVEELEGARKVSGRVVVLTNNVEWICDTVTVLIGGLYFKVRVIERVWDMPELGEILDSVVDSESESQSEAESRGQSLKSSEENDGGLLEDERSFTPSGKADSTPEDIDGTHLGNVSCGVASSAHVNQMEAAFLSGFLENEPETESSDTELLIKRSNQRIKNATTSSSIGNSVSSSFVQETSHQAQSKLINETNLAIEYPWQVTSVWGGQNLEFKALDSVGNSAGLLTVWDGNCFYLLSSSKKDGFIAIMGTWKGNSSKLGIVNVYAPQNLRKKVSLWEDIARSEIERKGTLFDKRGARAFNNFIADVCLNDMKLGGRNFTWMNSDCSKLSKFDRFLRSDGQGSHGIIFYRAGLREEDIGDLLTKVGDLLSAKVSDLKQKAKTKWLAEGDESTRFFHGMVNNQMNKGRIHGLNINGSWVTDPTLIKDAAFDFLKNKFEESNPITPILRSNLFKKITDEQKLWLESCFSVQEVKNAVWSCGNNKAPGPDGFTLNSSESFGPLLGTTLLRQRNRLLSKDEVSDGPLMVNEVIKWAKKKKKKLLIFKADFAKAFDSLNWNFLDNILLQMGFGEKWRGWVKGCVCTAKVSVLINGAPTKEFFLGKGVRQGDPLAPFLFILAVEGLNVAMHEALRKNIFRGVRLDDSADDVSIFQYADDTIFIGEWDWENAKMLIRILKCFEIFSGLKINMHKSSISGVVAKTLSSGGRRCLCKIVLGTSGSDYFSLYKAPRKVLNSLESIQSRFFWGGTDDKNKIGWVAWDCVVSDKKCGGLGIGSLRARDLALLAKWRWWERTEVDAKWRQVLYRCVCLSQIEKQIGVNWLPSNINIHLWRIGVNRLATLDNLNKRGVRLQANECVMCHSAAESLDHIFLNCSTTRHVGAHLSNWVDWWPIPDDTAQRFWPVSGLVAGDKCRIKVQKTIVAAFLWVMWAQRNNKAFKGCCKKETEICCEIQFRKSVVPSVVNFLVGIGGFVIR